MLLSYKRWERDHIRLDCYMLLVRPPIFTRSSRSLENIFVIGNDPKWLNGRSSLSVLTEKTAWHVFDSLVRNTVPYVNSCLLNYLQSSPTSVLLQTRGRFAYNHRKAYNSSLFGTCLTLWLLDQLTILDWNLPAQPCLVWRMFYATVGFLDLCKHWLIKWEPAFLQVHRRACRLPVSVVAYIGSIIFCQKHIMGRNMHCLSLRSHDDPLYGLCKSRGPPYGIWFMKRTTTLQVAMPL